MIWFPDTGYALLQIEDILLVAAIVIPSNITALNKRPEAHGATLFMPSNCTSMNSMPKFGTRPDTERRLIEHNCACPSLFDAAAANTAECGVEQGASRQLVVMKRGS
jgi:hypothetical protein